jgi:putative DNA primase/helicase
MLFARAGHAKTYTALGIAYAVARGDAFLGWQCERPGRVLYVDGEMPGSFLQQRLALYGPAPKGTLHIVCRDTFNLHREMMPDLGTPEGRQAIDAIIKRVRPDLVILDSLSTLVRSGEENSAEDWRPVQDWLMGHRWRGRSMLIIHHSGKSGDYRGTSKRIDTPETIIKLTKLLDAEKADDESAFELEFIKGRELWGGSEEPLMVWLAIRKGRIVWRHEQKRDVRREKIREMLKVGMTHADIAKELDLTRSRITQIVSELKTKGEKVVPLRRG